MNARKMFARAVAGRFLDRIYRIYKIKNVASFSQNPVNLVNPVQKPSRDDPRYLSRIHKLVPFLKYDSFMAIAKPGKAIH